MMDDDVMVLAKKGTSAEILLKGPDADETTFSQDLSSLRMFFAAVIVAISMVNLGLLVLCSRRWYWRRLRRDLLAGFGL